MGGSHLDLALGALMEEEDMVSLPVSQGQKLHTYGNRAGTQQGILEMNEEGKWTFSTDLEV